MKSMMYKSRIAIAVAIGIFPGVSVAAQPTPQCISEQYSGRMLMQCSDGTVSVSERGMLTVCSKGANGDTTCQKVKTDE